jgi:hypothetical protein
VQVHEARKRLRIGVQRGATAATLERVEIVPVDDQDVAQRGMDGREEARPRGASPGLGEPAARVVQAMVRPRAVAGHLEKVHGERRHTPQIAAHDPRRQVEFAAVMFACTPAEVIPRSISRHAFATGALALIATVGPGLVTEEGRRRGRTRSERIPALKCLSSCSIDETIQVVRAVKEELDILGTVPDG